MASFSFLAFLVDVPSLALSVARMVVRFRFFLHIGFRENREDLQLILFSALLLFSMVAGTICIMASLALGMGMPMQP